MEWMRMKTLSNENLSEMRPYPTSFAASIHRPHANKKYTTITRVIQFSLCLGHWFLCQYKKNSASSNSVHSNDYHLPCMLCSLLLSLPQPHGHDTVSAFDEFSYIYTELGLNWMKVVNKRHNRFDSFCNLRTNKFRNWMEHFNWLRLHHDWSDDSLIIGRNLKIYFYFSKKLWIHAKREVFEFITCVRIDVRSFMYSPIHYSFCTHIGFKHCYSNLFFFFFHWSRWRNNLVGNPHTNMITNFVCCESQSSQIRWFKLRQNLFIVFAGGRKESRRNVESYLCWMQERRDSTKLLTQISTYNVYTSTYVLVFCMFLRGNNNNKIITMSWSDDQKSKYRRNHIRTKLIDVSNTETSCKYQKLQYNLCTTLASSHIFRYSVQNRSNMYILMNIDSDDRRI